MIDHHLFDQSVSADEVLELDDRVIKGNVNIPLETLENAIKLFDKIKKNYIEYIQQFYSTAANIINRNYREPPQEMGDDESVLPF